MRRLGILAILYVGFAAPLGAVEIERTFDPGEIVTTDQKPGGTTRARPAGRDRRPWFSYRDVRWIGDDGFCLDTLWTRDESFARRQNSLASSIRFAEANGGVKQQCPPDAVAVPATREIAAASWREVRDLPVPTLSTKPNFAITGKKVYLEIEGEDDYRLAIDNPIGDDIMVTATSEYVVDWGDPSYPAKTVTRSRGGPWPTGDLTHVYTHAGVTRTIKVTQRWQATWSAGGRSGVLDELFTESTPLTLEIRQLQAVRNR